MGIGWFGGAAKIAGVSLAGVFLVGTVIATTGGTKTVSPAAATGAAATGPIGSGWTEIFPKTQLDQPPGKVRHTLTNGEHHFWVLSTDPSTYPGRDSGPRSELRFFNDYTTGQAQFEADIKVANGCSHASIMQIFGAPDRATAFMAWAMPDRLAYYNGATIYSPLYDRYLHLNVVHNGASGGISVYVNGVAHGTFKDHGRADHYFKVGVYHQKGMSSRCDVYVKNIHIYKK